MQNYFAKLMTTGLFESSSNKANHKGFSLTEVLVTVGMLSIISAIGTVSYNQYMTQGTKVAIKQDIQKQQEAFETCLSMNSYNYSKCDSHEKIGFVPGGELTSSIQMNTEKTKACLGSQKKVGPGQTRQTGERACAQYDEGKLVKKCFEHKEGADTTKHTKTGCAGGWNCCSGCTGTPKPTGCVVWDPSAGTTTGTTTGTTNGGQTAGGQTGGA